MSKLRTLVGLFLLIVSLGGILVMAGCATSPGTIEERGKPPMIDEYDPWKRPVYGY